MSASALVGHTLSERYQIVRLIGEGGMGAVYEAVHKALGKRVAIKTLREELGQDPNLRARLLREAQATSRISHNNIVNVTDVDIHDRKLLYLVMEYLEGEDLSQTLAREGRLDWRRVQRIGLQLCLGVAAAHAKKIIHRDLKPSNCFRVLSGDGEDFIKVLDFGIAKNLGPVSGKMHLSNTGTFHAVDQRRVLTEAGQTIGTMLYMSPEHLRGEQVDHRTDIYAVGVILYELLTGRTPFLMAGFFQSIEHDVPPTPSARARDVGIPGEFDRVVMRALAKRPEERFVSMIEFVEALRELPKEHAAAPRPQGKPSVARVDVDAPTLVRSNRQPSSASPPGAVIPWDRYYSTWSMSGMGLIGILMLLWAGASVYELAAVTASAAVGVAASSATKPPARRGLGEIRGEPRKVEPGTETVYFRPQRLLRAQPAAKRPPKAAAP